jgi:FkbM family methyltransferase
MAFSTKHKFLILTFSLMIFFLYFQRSPAPRARVEKIWAEGYSLPSALTMPNNCPPEMIHNPRVSEVAAWVSDVFSHNCRGNFIDVGANEGVGVLSNSNELENGLGWRGICIEPHPGAYLRMVPQRPLCRLINAGASPSSGGFLEFLAVSGYAEMLSSFVEGMPADHLERIDSEISKFGGSKEFVNVALISISDIILGSPRAAQFAVVDFLSVDVERRELYVLQGIDFEHIYFRAIMLEANTAADEEANSAALANYGYSKFEKRGINTIFVPTLSREETFIERVATTLGVSVDSINIGYRLVDKH